MVLMVTTGPLAMELALDPLFMGLIIKLLVPHEVHRKKVAKLRYRTILIKTGH